MIVQNNELRSNDNVITFDVKSIGAIIFITVLLILLAQYVSKKIAITTAFLIFLTSLLMNIEKLKEVFK